jgi:hypothetical protein
MALYTVRLAGLGSGALDIFAVGDHQPRQTWRTALETAKFLFGTFFLAAVASTWLVNLLQFA